MPTHRDQLLTIRSAAIAQLAELRETPKPTYTVDGQTVSWESYAGSLQGTVDWCDSKLAGDEPFEVHSQGYTP